MSNIQIDNLPSYETTFEVTNDALVRTILIYNCHRNFIKKEVIITKEEFIECYKNWIMNIEDDGK